VVDISGLGQAHDWVDEDVGLARTSSANGKLTMSSVHWVAGLEGDNTGPAELVKVQAELCRSISEGDIVVMLEAVDGVNLATNVKLLHGVVKVFDRGVLWVAAKDLLGLLLPTSRLACTSTP
jgi:hypothetical protein